MNGFQTTIFSTLILLTATAEASLPQDINDYFRQIHTKPNQVSIEIKTPIERWPNCEKPQIFPPVGRRNMGNISLPVQCGKKKQFIQLTVNVTGQYHVATRNITRGEKIEFVDIGTKKGLLHKLPSGTINDKVAIRGSIALRDINAGQTLTQSMMRKPWAIKAGQNVYVFANGNHFSVKYEGRAINNAAIGENIRVRLINGQVVNGSALENGSVQIALK
ncbi:flagellar basal body P-ring formation chaperone FlgA [Providencia vermicola]|uniref:Flagella basal body P-ring formation protein FlgA n=1 Tax=Providencia stuartii TaxID=588 RepID=A0AAI9I1W1_PROST|nr:MULTISPECIES: flagellar basal body P-ring formation chaperone FlgA [Providencia]ELR5036906.1 flagellar basal body P-ring formation protein FlgA [Providencia stuartii]ELR5120405.1 flagellar basal body P-ring formation protein FlgA [Providencia stuartii]ELR5142950.1 flagellar basal body P-ring formation protein FlgA [Providencia stuartii]MBG5917872.1 flagellar basal body P-ring formation protein FlgA [Providencia stuartii]MTB39984.1 flagellar basal body P-ring formation protein FlgA [Providen